MSLTPGDGLLLRGFKDHPSETCVLSYGAPKEKGRYHLALWLGTWADGEASINERLNLLGWVFNPELARALRADDSPANASINGDSPSIRADADVGQGSSK